jgi:actin-like ATPase involved in cell morphogenesis
MYFDTMMSFLGKQKRGGPIVRTRKFFVVPVGIPPVEKHAEKETAESAGAPEMYLIGSMGRSYPSVPDSIYLLVS